MQHSAFEHPSQSPPRFIVGQPRVHDRVYVHHRLASPAQVRAAEQQEDHRELLKERLITIFRGAGALLAVVAIAIQCSLI